MANFLTRAFGGVERFLGINQPQKPQQPQPQQQPQQINFNNLKQQSLRQAATPPLQQQPQAPAPKLVTNTNAANAKPAAPPALPQPVGVQQSPFLNNLVHGGLQVPQNASHTYHDATGNVIGWEDNTGSHLTPLGSKQQSASIQAAQPQQPHQNPVSAVGGALFHKTAQFVNTVRGGIITPIVGAAVSNIAPLRGGMSKQDIQNAAYQESTSLLTGDNKGLFGAGSVYKNQADLNNTSIRHIAAKTIGTEAGGVAEIAPWFIGAGEANAAAHGGQLAAGAKVVGTGAGVGALGSAGGQLADNGHINPAEVFKSAAIGGATAGVVHGATKVVGAGANKLMGGMINDARSQISQHIATNPELAQAYQNHLATGALKQQIAHHLATNPVALDNALNQTTAHIIAAVPGISGNEAAVASIRSNSELGNVLHAAVTQDESLLEHSLRKVMPGAPEDVIQRAKNTISGEERPLTTAPTDEAAKLQEAKISQQQETAKAQAVADEAAAKEAELANHPPEVDPKLLTEQAHLQPLTPEDIGAMAGSKNVPQITSMLGHTDVPVRERVQIAHDVSTLDNPQDVAAYLNSKGILADSGADQAAANGAPVLTAEEQQLQAANQIQNGSPAPDVVAGEKAIGQDAPVAGNQPEHAAIAQNASAIDTKAETIQPKLKQSVQYKLDNKVELTPAEQRYVEAKNLAAQAQSVALREKQQAETARLANPNTGVEAPNTTFTDRIAKDEAIPQETRDAVTNLTHQVNNDKIMVSSAKTLVKNDMNTARQIFDNKELLGSLNLDGHIHLGNALTDEYNRLGNTAEAGKVYDDLIQTATRAGQGLRATQAISKISPQGIVKFARNIADKQGKTLTPELEAELTATSKEIAKMPDGVEKARAIQKMVEMAKQPTSWEKAGDFVGGVLSVPRALMATGDLSFGGRQGAVLGSRFPKEWAEANVRGARYAVSQEAFDKGMSDLANLTDKNGHPMTAVFKRMGLDMPAVIGKSEETFGNTGVLESKALKKVGVGHIVAGSDRAYSGAAAEMRANIAKKIIDSYGGVGELKNWTSKDYSDLGRVINTATGRGQGKEGGWFEKAAPTLGQTLFSARLWKSRLDLLNPVYYAKLSPAARKVALQSSASFGATVGVVLTAAAAAGANVELDPRSSDFGKIKVGNTRYDIMGGLQQNIVLAARELSGQKKNSSTGEVTSLTDGKFGHANRFTTLSDFVTNKETPVLGAATRILKGKDMGGNPVNPWTEVAKLFIPLGAQDVYSASQDAAASNGGNTTPGTIAKGVAKALPGFGGAGVQTYAPTGTKLTPGKVDPSTLSPQDLTKYEKGVSDSFVKTLSPQDKAIYDLSNNSDAATFAIRNGKVTQDQLDEIQVRENKTRDAAGLPLHYYGGITDAQYQAFDPTTQAVVKQASLQGSTKFGKANISPESEQLIKTAAQNAWPGVGTIHPTNKMALDYVKLEKATAEAPGDQAKQFEAVKTFWKSAVKNEYSDAVAQMYEDGNSQTTNETSKGYGFSSKDIQRLASGVTLNGKKYVLTKPDVDKMMELDNRLLTSGLIDSPKFSNKVRASLGYGDAPNTQQGMGYSGGSGGGSSSPTVANQHGSSYITSQGGGGSGGGGGNLLDLVPKQAAAPQLNLSKFRAPTSKPAKIRINL